MTTISLIVAVADNNVIGKDNKMLWHIPEDFKYFKSVTLGKPCVMGRKTYESIFDALGKPLPGRDSIVITRGGFEDGHAIVTSSLENAIEKATALTADEVMIIGGAQIYNLALESDLVDKIYLTQVHQSPEGDAFFPELSGDKWAETSRDERDGYSFIVLEKLG